MIDTRTEGSKGFGYGSYVCVHMHMSLDNRNLKQPFRGRELHVGIRAKGCDEGPGLELQKVQG